MAGSTRSRSGREATIRRARKRRRRRRWTILIISTVPIAIVAGLIILAQDGGINLDQIKDYSALPQGFEADGSPYLGNYDAPVTLIEYSDFSCPACMAFSETVHQLIDTYVADGMLKIVYKPLTFVNPQTSPIAATAALCTAEQGKFWEMHDVLFEILGTQGSNAFTASYLSKTAESLGADKNVFNVCMRAQEHQQLLQNLAVEAQTLGISGTPTVILNGEMLPSGAVPYDALEKMIVELTSQAVHSPLQPS